MKPAIDGPTQLSPARIRLALLALAMGGFGIGSSEFAAMGLLPNLAHDLLPSLYAASPSGANAQAGWAVSLYALGVVVGAPTIAAFAARLPRKKLVLWLLVAFTVGTFATALAPSFGFVLLARFLCGLPHGAYFGIASLVAASLMGPGNRGKGVAFVLSGLTIANIIGVPFVTWLGQTAGWRASYVVIAGMFAVTFVAVLLLVPWQKGDPRATMRNELRAFSRPQVWLALLIGAIGFGGFFAIYTFIAPIVTEVTGLGASAVPLILVMIGVAMTIGNLIGGWGADRHLKRFMIVAFVAFLIGLVGLYFTAGTLVGLVGFAFLVSVAASALSPAIQTRLMDVAHDSQSIAAALNHAALNFANASGAFLGGLTVAAGLGYLSPILVGVALCLAGIALSVVSFGLERRRRRAAVPAVPATPRELAGERESALAGQRESALAGPRPVD